MAWTSPKTWTADELLTASDMNTYLSDNLSALYALVQGGGRKNLLHNGAMQVAQRGVGPVASITTSAFTADRWGVYMNACGTWTWSVEADAPTGSGFRNSTKVLCTTNDASPAAGDYVQFVQVIEGRNAQTIKKGTTSAEQLTLSFWTKSNKTGVYVVQLEDVDNNRQVCATYTIDSSGTWEQQTITFPADLTGAFDNDANGSFAVEFWLAAGSTYTSGTLSTTWAAGNNANRAVGQTNLAASTNNYWMVTGVQLEVGSASTGFEHKDYGTELAECQRYYNPGENPVGALMPYAGATAPAGWLLCYGQAVSRTTYSDLYTAIGTTYGTGDGSTTFNLPDLRGRTIAALDNMGGSDAARLDWANTLGTASGSQTHTLQTTEIPSHLHTVDPPATATGSMSANWSHTHNSFYNSDPRTGAQGGDMIAYGSNSNAAWRTVNPGIGAADINHTHTVDIAQFNSGNTGSGGAHNNMQPTILLNYIIRAIGRAVSADL